MHDYIVFHGSIDYRVELNLIDDNYVKVALISLSLILLGKCAS